MSVTTVPNMPRRVARRRDSMRSKVYTAEKEALPAWWYEGWTEEQTVAYITTVLRTRWFEARWPKFAKQVRVWDRPPTSGQFMSKDAVNVRWRRGYGATAWKSGNEIVFGVTGNNLGRAIILHELAHLIAPENAAHGRYFCKTYLLLVERYLGTGAYRALRKAFVRHGVKFRAERKLSADVLAAAKRRGQLLAQRKREAEEESA
jgi:hypothetical protein